MMRAALLSLVLIWPAAAAGRSIVVAVSDPSAAAVVGAQVTLQCPGNTEQLARTGDAGTVSFDGVTGDGCAVKVLQPGFKTWKGSAGGAGTVEARLEVSMIQNTTEVKPKSAGRKFMDWITSCTRR